ncbi:MAG: hypothetical protein ACYDD0_00495, partial [Candidatus Dormibacteria bacterium]
MTSIERTAYPRFGRLVTAQEVVELSPTLDEVTWAKAFDLLPFGEYDRGKSISPGLLRVSGL